MSRCTKAGREHSQAASPSWPMEIFHTIDIRLSIHIGDDRGAGTLFPGVWSFSVSSAS